MATCGQRLFSVLAWTSVWRSSSYRGLETTYGVLDANLDLTWGCRFRHTFRYRFGIDLGMVKCGHETERPVNCSKSILHQRRILYHVRMSLYPSFGLGVSVSYEGSI